MKNWIDPAIAIQAIVWGSLVLGFWVVVTARVYVEEAICR